MKKFMFLFVVGSIFVTIGCGTSRRKCPDCPGYIQKYLPYKAGEILSFQNESLETMNFEVEACWPTHRTIVSTYADCSCVIIAELKSDSISMTCFFGDDPGSVNALTYTCSLDCFGKKFSLEWEMKGVSPFDAVTESVVDNIIELKNVRGSSRITGIKIEKNIGLIEFRDTLSNCTWKLVR